MTPQQFAAKWKQANLSERSASQQHFLDLCDVLGQPKPAAVDPEGTEYTFERGASKTDGGAGWADVWKRGYFGWEYKGKHKDLTAAYQQLLKYRESLDNPPLLVVCDMNRFEIHTNFTGTAKRVYAFDLDGFERLENLDVLRRLFTDPESLKPGKTAERITAEAAEQIGKLAESMWARNIPAEQAAHFLMKCMFCMFAEDIGLLPEKLFSKVLKNAKLDPNRLEKQLGGLFTAMATGTDFGADEILHFNGGLFEYGDVEKLTVAEIQYLVDANIHDWSDVEPTIFGTLFERMLDPAKRSQIGAHYTSTADILTLLEPVVMVPLRREWADVQAKCLELWPKIQEESKKRAAAGKGKRKGPSKPRAQFDRLIDDFAHRFAEVKILDPACGSGNFLYSAIRLLLDLEKEVYRFASQYGVSFIPQVRPSQLAGIEINRSAQELAQVVIWIGYLQWKHHNGFSIPRNPVLDPIDSIRCMDAILDLSDPEHPTEPEWPAADYIVGNPPFLGGKLLRANMGDQYIDAAFRVWADRVPREADLCCYWFEKARAQIEQGKLRRAGLLATQGIRGGANREVLKRIKESGGIFFAESDRDWVLDGANVHVSMIAFDNGSEKSCILDGLPTVSVNANLESAADTTRAFPLMANRNRCFMGDTKGGAFDICENAALEMLHAPNPHGRSNSDIVVPWVNGLDITRQPRSMWIIDFGVESNLELATQYELPFAHVEKFVLPARTKNKRESYRDKWWTHVEPRPALRSKIANRTRFVCTPSVSKFRLFCWIEAPTLPDHQLLVFANDEPWFFGILNSRLHEIWGLRLGTRLETRPRYTPTTCFETYPFPMTAVAWESQVATAVTELDRLRT
ncbi:MAG: class I SAM-dependent DNA methyltransferase, partial [Planctomycetota bacterium]|nr:class I SAM-dependent DNA methyltransferase [Planctomycetota bacterium]